MRGLLLRGVVALLVVTAALAIAVLLFGDFGETEGKILGTTGLLAASGLLALPAAMLLDQRRRAVLAVSLVAAVVVALVLSLVGMWGEVDSEALGKSLVTAWLVTVALTQTAALATLRRATPVTRRLFVASTALVSLAVGVVLVLVWSESEAEWAIRAVGALGVADALSVALQPLLARAAAPSAPGVRRVTIEGDDAAVEAAIRAAEQAGARVVAGGNPRRGVEH